MPERSLCSAVPTINRNDTASPNKHANAFAPNLSDGLPNTGTW
jgi:hypothetical protein